MQMIEFYCGCGARLAAPPGTPSVQCPNCGAFAAVPPGAVPGHGPVGMPHGQQVRPKAGKIGPIIMLSLGLLVLIVRGVMGDPRGWAASDPGDANAIGIGFVVVGLGLLLGGGYQLLKR